MSVAFRSSRNFKVWQYSVSDGRLLLRSPRPRGGDTRVDVQFTGVRLMLLRPTYDGLTIRPASADERDLLLNRYGIDAAQGQIHILGRGLASFVVSGGVQWHEDSDPEGDPSWLGPPGGRGPRAGSAGS